MSHVTTLRGVTLNDVEAIKTAALRLKTAGVNCHITENKKPRVHGYDAAPTCDLVLNLPDGAYDVGLKANDKGEFEPVFDTYMNHVGKQVGAVVTVPGTSAAAQQKQLGRFLQTYAEEAARNQMSDQGYIVEDVYTDEETGEVAMVFAEM